MRLVVNKKQFEAWSKLRERGENKFIWLRGVIFWGVLTALLWSILMQFITPTDNFLRRTIIAFILFPIGGFFWGKIVWKSSEKNYNEYKNAQK